MTDPTESTKELTEKTLDLADESGLREMIAEISAKHSLETFEQKSQIPIPLDLIEDTRDTLEISENSSQNLDTLCEIINDPTTALEFPFLMTGERNIKNFDLLHSAGSKLESRIVNADPNLLGQAMGRAIDSGQDIFVLCHTHPKLPAREQSNVFTNQLSPDTKAKYKIKDVGLNISLQDLYQLVFFQEAIKPMIANDARVYIGILMFNGEMNAISIIDGKFKKTRLAYQK